MSRTFAIAFVLAALSGCVDPHSRFNDFGGRVTDAAHKADIDAMPLQNIPDVSGTWLIALSPSIDPTDVIQLVSTMGFTKTSTGATIDFSMQPLKASDRTPVGNPVVLKNVTVNQAGEFLAVFAALPDPEPAGTKEDCMPPATNPVILPGAADSLNLQLVIEVSLKGVIHSKDLFCGTVSGYVNNLGCVSLEGSTFGAIRVPAGTTGSALPDPVTACPSAMTPDAGGADAGGPDAAAAQDAAAQADAALQDAGP